MKEVQRVAIVVTYEDTVPNDNVTRMLMGLVATLQRVKGMQVVQVLASGRTERAAVDLDALLAAVELKGEEVNTTYAHSEGATLPAGTPVNWGE